MLTIDYVTETSFLSDKPETRRCSKRIYRGFPVLNGDITTSYPSFRIVTYRGAHGVFSKY